MSCMIINIKQIILTPPIVIAVKKINPEKELYNKIVDDGTLRLSRMDNMMSLDFKALIESEPIQLRKAYTSDGRPKGIMINGVGYPLYMIVNGRHRVVRAILEGYEDINTIIID